MSKEEFDTSSDAVRVAGPLKYAKSVTFDEPLDLEMGGQLPGVTAAYETYGTLNAARDNAVFICHALSGDSHVARHTPDDAPGWWDLGVGPGKPVDTDKYFVICANVLGGCRGTTGPGSVNPQTGRPYGADFPTITIGDMVNVHRRVVAHLGVEKLLAVVGGSMGGLKVLQWAARYPDSTRGIVLIATSARLSSQALAFDVVGRNAIMHDPNFHDGNYYDGPTPDVGLAIARMIGHITYLSREAMREKFEADRFQPRDVPVEFEKKFSVGSYLGYLGAKFVDRFDANTYVKLSMAMDVFDIGSTASELSRVFQPSQAAWLIFSFTSDWLFSPEESQEIVKALSSTNKRVSYCNIESSCGHDAFLLPNDLEMYGGLIGAFLANLGGARAADSAGSQESPRRRRKTAATSIFQSHRLDYDRIVDLIPLSASVLDLGCGDGELLLRLKARGCGRITGVEISEQSILECVRQGLDVIHADLNRGLPGYVDAQFDYVVLSRTLQTVRDVERVIDEMVRVGGRCVVTFPNFAYHKLRKMLAEDGKAPASGGVLRHNWYDSPNIRFFSIADFEEFCAAKGLTVHRRVALDTEAGAEVADDPNHNADLAIFVISR